MKRLVAFAVGGAVAFLALVAAGVYGWLWTSLPVVSGTIEIGTEAGLESRVEILRDAYGVPHIRAESASDAYFALGFVHAQDRLWQMEATRRLGAGRLAEVVGERALPTDRLMRVLGLYRLAERQYARLLDESRAALDSYAAGVNSFIAGHHGAWPPEFTLLGFEPEPWKPADSLVWGKLMAFRLTGNWQDELLRIRLGALLDTERIEQLWPDHGVENASPPENTADLSPAAERLMAAYPELIRAPAGASNAWAIGRRHSVTLGPLLANDPHLGFKVPILWYLARIESPDLSVTGATVPGVPFVVVGHNRSVAWGLTSAQVDSADLFIERLADGQPGSYLTPEGPRPFLTRTETIAVRGSDPETLMVRTTRHGPVISDVLGGLPGADRVLALSATFLRDGDLTPQAVHGFNLAENMGQFRAALVDLHAPVQTVLYADREGSIASWVAGKVPIRASGHGWWASPGWTGERDWTGFLPFRELPATIDPEEDRLITANNRMVDDAFPYFLSDDWAPGYRARRIGEMLDESPAQSMETMARIQRDDVSVMVRDLLPAMLDSVGPVPPHESRILEVMSLWDGRMSRRRPEPLLFMAWLREFDRAVSADELGELHRQFPMSRPRFLASVLTDHSEWCDDVITEATETCADVLAASLKNAVKELTASYGSSFVRWHWGAAHKARFLHPLAEGIPFGEAVAGLEVSTDGGDFTVNRGAMRVNRRDRPYDHVHGPGFRAIYDLADLSRSRFMIATGQSGNPLSPHYDDFLSDWRDGRYLRLDLNRRDIQETAVGLLVLEPEPQP